MLLDEARIEALLVEVNRLIEEHADKAGEMLCGVNAIEEPAYPPNGGFTLDEREVLQSSSYRPEDLNAVRKLVAGAIATAFFHFFAVVDAVGAPRYYSGEWLPLRFEEVPDDVEAIDEVMLHDELFDKYWTWRRLRPETGWRLDNWTGPDPTKG